MTTIIKAQGTLDQKAYLNIGFNEKYLHIPLTAFMLYQRKLKLKFY